MTDSRSVDPAVDRSFDPWQDEELMDQVFGKYLRQRSPLGRTLSSFRLKQKRWLWRTVVGSTHALKRLLDIAVAMLAIALLSPILIVTWLAIQIEDPGSPIFRQVRVGRWGQTFTMFKFRSMVMNADTLKAGLLEENESAAGVIFKMKQDPRITCVGRWIRKFSIDELPQLFNVLNGDMTLVGPRPPLPSEVEAYTLSDRRRLDVVPGITGLWQVSGRSDIDFQGQVRLDIEYIRTQGFWRDL